VTWGAAAKKVSSLCLSLAVGCAVALASPAVGVAATRYAEPNGNGPSGLGGCPLSDPCSLTDAVEDGAVADGDTVLMRPGPYNRPTATLTIDDDITLEPDVGLPRQRINAGATGIAVDIDSSAPNAVIRDIDIFDDNTAPTAIGLSMDFGGTAERMFVSSVGLTSCAVIGAIIRDSVCLLNGPYSHGALEADAAGPTITETSFLRNVTAISKGAIGPGVYVKAGAGADITINARNVIADGVANDVGALTDGTMSTSATLNLASSDYATADDPPGADTFITPVSAAGNVQAPPQYAGFGTDDFRELATSPTIDRGTADAFLGSTDLDGNARTHGAAPDIGAYEFAPAPPDVIPASTPPLVASKSKCKKGFKLKKVKHKKRCVKKKTRKGQ
jgi:hypothetical protein